MCLTYYFLKVDIVTPSGEVPVAVCTYKQPQDDLIIVAENVEMISAYLSFSQDVSKPYTFMLRVANSHFQ